MVAALAMWAEAEARRAQELERIPPAPAASAMAATAGIVSTKGGQVALPNERMVGRSACSSASSVDALPSSLWHAPSGAGPPTARALRKYGCS